MAEAKKKSETKAATKKTNGKAKNSSSATAKGKSAATNKKSTTGEQKRGGSHAPVKGGAERLRRAVDRRVGKNSEKLADVLTNKALAGDLAFAKAVVALADAKKPDPVKKPIGPRFVELLAKEPRWEGEPKDIEDSDEDID
jgi:hypothetical protein